MSRTRSCLTRHQQEALRELGFLFVRANKHEIWVHSSGRMMSTSKTASDRRAWKNILSQARKIIDAQIP